MLYFFISSILFFRFVKNERFFLVLIFENDGNWTQNKKKNALE